MSAMSDRYAALIEDPPVVDAPFYFPLTDKGYEIKPNFPRLGADMARDLSTDMLEYKGLAEGQSAMCHWLRHGQQDGPPQQICNGRTEIE